MPAQEKFCEIKNILKICVAHLGYFSIACSGDKIQFRIEYPSLVTCICAQPGKTVIIYIRGPCLCCLGMQVLNLSAGLSAVWYDN